MLKEWQINYRDENGITQQQTVKKVDYREAHKAACEMFPTCEIVLIVEGDIVTE